MGKTVPPEQNLALAFKSLDQGLKDQAIVYFRRVVMFSENHASVDIAQRQIYLLTSDRSKMESK